MQVPNVFQTILEVFREVPGVNQKLMEAFVRVQKVPETSEIFWKVPKASEIFWKVPSGTAPTALGSKVPKGHSRQPPRVQRGQGNWTGCPIKIRTSVVT